MEKLHSGETVTPTRRAQNLTIDPKNYSQNESNNRKQYQPHSPSYPRNEEPTPRKKFESTPSDRNLPEVNRKNNQGNIIEYQSQSQGGTPLSPRSKQLAQQQQQQPRPNAAATTQSQQLVVVQNNSQRQKGSNQQQQQQDRNYRQEEIDMKRIEIGLENLGNTCFMNSTLQCLLHIQPLISYFLEGRMDYDLNPTSPKKGMLATSFNNLIRDIFNGKSGGSIAPVNFQRAVSPSILFLHIKQISLS
jgi:ubiquitin C-terminal hydrolase